MGQGYYTSSVDVLLRLALLLAAFLVFGLAATFMEIVVPYAMPELAGASAKYVVWGGAVLLLVVAVFTIPGEFDENLAALSSYLYCLLVLRTFLKWREADQLSDMFGNNAYETWHPLTEVRQLPAASRKAAIFAAAERAGRLRMPRDEVWRRRDKRIKTVTGAVLTAVWLMTLFVASTSNFQEFNVRGFLILGVVPALFPWAIVGLTVALTR